MEVPAGSWTYSPQLTYGYNDMFGWRNLNNILIGSLFKPTGKDSVRLNNDSIRLAEKADGL